MLLFLSTLGFFLCCLHCRAPPSLSENRTENGLRPGWLFWLHLGSVVSADAFLLVIGGGQHSEMNHQNLCTVVKRSVPSPMPTAALFTVVKR